ncbi:hypothetical protein MG293_017044 [Ovis ammon polii]|uniref:Uncharacterized protein n=1 Tax=Ovis ammon polii TaxID=230172 RepID=A0AAD4TU03_OVIAM|nr:hypothetical protein MG293_017044 [Ovis ammon polii]
MGAAKPCLVFTVQVRKECRHLAEPLTWMMHQERLPEPPVIPNFILNGLAQPCRSFVFGSQDTWRTVLAQGLPKPDLSPQHHQGTLRKEGIEGHLSGPACPEHSRAAAHSPGGSCEGSPRLTRPPRPSCGKQTVASLLKAPDRYIRNLQTALFGKPSPKEEAESNKDRFIFDFKVANCLKIMRKIKIYNFTLPGTSTKLSGKENIIHLQYEILQRGQREVSHPVPQLDRCSDPLTGKETDWSANELTKAEPNEKLNSERRYTPTHCLAHGGLVCNGRSQLLFNMLSWETVKLRMNAYDVSDVRCNFCKTNDIWYRDQMGRLEVLELEPAGNEEEIINTNKSCIGAMTPPGRSKETQKVLDLSPLAAWGLGPGGGRCGGHIWRNLGRKAKATVFLLFVKVSHVNGSMDTGEQSSSCIGHSLGPDAERGAAGEIRSGTETAPSPPLRLYSLRNLGYQKASAFSGFMYTPRAENFRQRSDKIIFAFLPKSGDGGSFGAPCPQTPWKAALRFLPLVSASAREPPISAPLGALGSPAWRSRVPPERYGETSTVSSLSPHTSRWNPVEVLFKPMLWSCGCQLCCCPQKGHSRPGHQEGLTTWKRHHTHRMVWTSLSAGTDEASPDTQRALCKYVGSGCVMNLDFKLQKLEMERSPWVSLVDQLPDWDLLAPTRTIPWKQDAGQGG